MNEVDKEQLEKDSIKRKRRNGVITIIVIIIVIPFITRFMDYLNSLQG